MHGAGNMTPFETQYAARAVRTPAALTAQRTPAAWRAFAHLRRAWLNADERPGRPRPPAHRAKDRAPVHAETRHKDRCRDAVIPCDSMPCVSP
jgi:hypothetical protein